MRRAAKAHLHCPSKIGAMDVMQEVIQLLDGVLNWNGRGHAYTRDTALLGVMPDLDSMAVLSLIVGMTERFGIVIGDDELHGDVFQNIGSLVDFISAKLAR